MCGVLGQRCVEDPSTVGEHLKRQSRSIHSKNQHKTKPAKGVSAPAAPATPVLTAPALSDALPVAPEKGYLRATIESETVEKTVSYLSGYAPTLVGLYGNLKERLPETIKGHVNSLETDYVVPYTKQGLVVANDTVDKVDEFVSKTEAQVRTSVTTTAESLRTNVESTTEAVRFFGDNDRLLSTLGSVSQAGVVRPAQAAIWDLRQSGKL